MLHKQIIQSREAPKVLNKFRVIWENNGVFYTWNGASWEPLKDNEGPMTSKDKAKLDAYPAYSELKTIIENNGGGSGGTGGETADIEELTNEEIDEIISLS